MSRNRCPADKTGAQVGAQPLQGTNQGLIKQGISQAQALLMERSNLLKSAQGKLSLAQPRLVLLTYCSRYTPVKLTPENRSRFYMRLVSM
jgi:hypothetical protein